MRRYVVTKPFRADVGGEEILLEAGEIIPGARVREVESWGRSVHHLIQTHRLAPVDVVSDGELTDEQVVDARGPVLLSFFSDEALLAELESRGVQPGADGDAEPEVEPEPEAEIDAEVDAEGNLEKPAGKAAKAAKQ